MGSVERAFYNSVSEISRVYQEFNHIYQKTLSIAIQSEMSDYNNFTFLINLYKFISMLQVALFLLQNKYYCNI